MAVSQKLQEVESDVLDATPLCLDCGLCCNGAIHNYGVLKESEVGLAEQLGMSIERTRDYLGFAQPCPKHDGKQCTIYEIRPSTCVNYYCGLAARYRKGEIPLENALLLVTEAWRLFQSAVASLPSGWTYRELRAKLRRRMGGKFGGDLTAEESVQLKDPLLKAMLLDVFLDRNFRLGREIIFDASSRGEAAKKDAAT